MQLEFALGGERWQIRCATERAPRTLARLAAHLPMDLQLHTPKIAGSHIYWHAPFVEGVEGAVNVLDAAPGAFIYWPVRQFLEIVFAPLQAETASITVLGQLEGGVERLAALGARLREQHGRRLFAGILTRADGAGPAAPDADGVLPAALAARARGLWRACSDEILALTRSRAIMHPAGPLFMAESEARVLHETLFELREAALAGGGDGPIRFAAVRALDRAGRRLADFCHLTETGRLFADLAALLDDPARPLPAVLEAAILASGRTAAWLDLQIPWFDVNEALRAALPSPARPRLEPQPGE
ncbi:hypothetical protein GCM10011390_26170 [Aureimonas endophytica]|uniref:Uncharacterized protein n=1 Tax=Aureimonas endophytica TaxID=2027858 RepID=A0A916ZNC6_9HYPH|nr:hypothetical protein [Aureimonas endophytica]GGE05889.1 hypothetical protein GCM10011390_26170 [Aureimonas endophytica]